MYTLSAYVAASRLHQNRHYLSDVIFGAALGTVAGRTVTKHGRDTWSVAAAPTRGGGLTLGIVRVRSMLDNRLDEGFGLPAFAKSSTSGKSERSHSWTVMRFANRDCHAIYESRITNHE